MKLLNVYKREISSWIVCVIKGYLKGFLRKFKDFILTPKGFSTNLKKRFSLCIHSWISNLSFTFSFINSSFTFSSSLWHWFLILLFLHSFFLYLFIYNSLHSFVLYCRYSFLFILFILITFPQILLFFFQSFLSLFNSFLLESHFFIRLFLYH